MKKTIKSMYAIGLCLLLFISACKKNEVPMSVTTGETIIKMQQAARTASTTESTGDMQSLEPNATVEISTELFTKLHQGNNIQMLPISQSHFTAVGILPNPGGPVIGPGSDPCNYSNVMAAFNAYKNANFPRFQAWANLHCQTYYGGWSKCGVCILFVFYPTTSINCPQVLHPYTPIVGINSIIQ